ncbi:hypothetical protein SAMN06265182_0547 [Persephonella hydrogeniphila]|uniref:Lipoprotein n=1 Tax=Persephonella hydrogeniphila TaxID=198703 RepID=A0A285N5E8_9AQUI|nr:hypothetical protein [Persephonella hydrogeniphila]SNZ04077.1 hypothetical protein SAMN06265182_0547 [Persephonella hydrogeniphila]
MNRIFFLLIFLSSMFLYGCEDRPSDDLIRENLKGLESIGDIKNYKRLNGYRDGNYYVVEYSFDLYIDQNKLKSALNKAKNMDSIESFQIGVALFGLALRCSKKAIEGKEPCKIKDKIKFVKGEKGWSVVE